MSMSYDFQLDMETENSNSVILKNIKPKSKVLEIGCAHGRMTKYLKEELECKVTIVELNQEAGKTAAQWAEKSFLGEDIENESLFYKFSRNADKFDYIIFADVLEHLQNPDKVLNKFKNIANEIWISIPNIGHNAVMIDLWNNLFTYRESGLLDKTHLRFFTYYSLKQMVEQCGLKIVKEINLINVVENTEFNNNYSKVPPTVEILLKRREYGEVYQFVWKLSV